MAKKFDTYEQALAYSINQTNGVAILSNGKDFAIAEDDADLRRLREEGYEFHEE
jgi:hypothetical protein